MYKLESKLLANVPGYSLLKNVTQSMAGVTSTEKMETVIVKTDDGWQIAFLMEEIDEEHAVVFVPGHPARSAARFGIWKRRISSLRIFQHSRLSTICDKWEPVGNCF